MTSREAGSGDDSNRSCPVDHNAASKKSSSSWSPRQWWSSSRSEPTVTNNKQIDPTPSGCPVKHDAAASGCPVKGTSNASPFAIPASVEEAARHAQFPQPDQKVPLSTERSISSIPRANDEKVAPETLPRHQPSEAKSWVYPSEQQFYNAMRRKGWQHVDETTIPFVVKIHNAVNERGWSEVRRWERDLHSCDNPRLVRFMGRPNDTSPKAWINTHLRFYKAPFDRHDWFIDRGDGKEPTRYVIDFYNGDETSTDKEKNANILSFTKERPSMYLDVRPALDSPMAAVDRVHMFFRETFPGLFGLFASPRPPPTHAGGSAPPGQTTVAQEKPNDS